ncbi:anti-anti-sigma factor [Roseivirga seohaensis subsp. aquiponti]|uniref:Anti-sigma factor antagonist n=1 Tax=Roseivirga seohaensis subsp. aquiponti TaxID=1566026 RepID=A0A0L8AGK3_9BACT|nr:STAS domain-containing protein [Roseivirga seohaensis]KOF01416.1 anti-anti-sigma factor [Roseivirga seohaensis subsp. aquiponti]
MDYSSKIDSETLILSLVGNLIGEEVGVALLKEADIAISEGVKYCIIDINEVKYINSSGIGVLITILTKFRNQSGEVCIVNPSEHVKKLLIITKLNAIFNIEKTVDEAILKLKSEN